MGSRNLSFKKKINKLMLEKLELAEEGAPPSGGPFITRD